jgi:CheY-like chemotaxis protein
VIERIKVAVLDDDTEDKMRAWNDLLKEMLPGAEPQHYSTAIEFIEQPEYEIDTDVVLLDIQGMASTVKTIKAIHAKWPRLPIVILSKIAVSNKTLKLFRAGARGYILKETVPPSIPRPYGGDPDDKGWKDLALLITQLAKEYQPIKGVLYGNRVIGRLRKTSADKPESLKRLVRQYEFLRLIERTNNPTLQRLFAAETITKPDRDCYEIPFYSAKSLREKLLEMRDEGEIVETAKAVLPDILKDLKTELFEKTPPRPVTDKSTWFDDSYVGKLTERITQTLQHCAACNNGARANLESVLLADRITLNDEDFLSPMKILDLIRSDAKALARSVPEKVGYIHGDLHFANILVDATILERPFVKLIDPAGFSNADFAYDLGKILLSTDGLHDMIDEEYLGDAKLLLSVRKVGSSVSVSEPERVKERKRDLSLGRSGDIISAHYQAISDLHFSGYANIASWLRNELLPTLFSEDADIVIRARLNAGLLSCTVGKFHIERDPHQQGPHKVIAFYVMGVKLLNRLARDLGLDVDSHFKRV